MSNATAPSGRTLNELAELVGGHVDGDGSTRIRRVAALDSAGPEDLGLLTDVSLRCGAETPDIFSRELVRVSDSRSASDAPRTSWETMVLPPLLYQSR
jgi:hypothetical protein